MVGDHHGEDNNDGDEDEDGEDDLEIRKITDPNQKRITAAR